MVTYFYSLKYICCRIKNTILIIKISGTSEAEVAIKSDTFLCILGGGQLKGERWEGTANQRQNIKSKEEDIQEEDVSSFQASSSLKSCDPLSQSDGEKVVSSSWAAFLCACSSPPPPPMAPSSKMSSSKVSSFQASSSETENVGRMRSTLKRRTLWRRILCLRYFWCAIGLWLLVQS